MRKMKIKLLMLFVSILAVVVTTNCSSEQEIINNEKSKINLKSFSIRENLNSHKHSKLINKLKSDLKSDFSQNRVSYDTTHSIFIDFENGFYAEYENSHSYTFPVHNFNSETDKLQNLLININEDNEYDVYHIVYDFNKNECINFTQEQINQTTKQLRKLENISQILTNFNNSRWTYNCIEWGYYSSVPPYEGDLVGKWGALNTLVWVSLGEACMWNESGGGSTGGDGGSGGNYPPNSDGSGATTQPLLIINPVVIPPFSFDNYEQATFYSSLTTNKRNWLNHVNNAFYHNWVYELTSDGMMGDANFNFANYIINFGISNSITINNINVFISNYGDQSFVKELFNLAIVEANQLDVDELINMSLVLEFNENDFLVDETAIGYFASNMDAGSSLPPNYYPTLGIKIFMRYKALKHLNPGWSKATCMWYASKEFIHIALDGFGLIPVIGEPADLLNGVLYAIDGDGLNATLSIASALPIVGWGSTATKYGIKIVEASNIASKVKLVWKITSAGVDFGSPSKLRKVLNITSSTLQAHHIIPWASRNHRVVQNAALSGHAFHMNEFINGIAVASWRNQPNHNAYNTLIRSKLDALPSNLTPDQAFNHLTNILNQAKQAIINNPNLHLNDIIF